jgi:hypothetical protein
MCREAGIWRSGNKRALSAGADVANAASFAVMRRLGMHFRKNVQYPLGAGMEYEFDRNEVGVPAGAFFVTDRLVNSSARAGRQMLV